MSDVLQRVLEMACEWAGNKARQMGEPWAFSVQQINVTRSDWHRNQTAQVQIEGMLTETAMLVAQGERPRIADPLVGELMPPLSSPSWDALSYFPDSSPKVGVDGAAAVDSAAAASFMAFADPGLWAGLRALLQKYEMGLQHAWELATEAEPSARAKTAAMAAEKAPQADLVGRLLVAVQAQRDRVERAVTDLTEELERQKARDPEEELRRRIRLRIRDRYASEELMLREFQSFLWANYSALLPEHVKPNAVPEFLKDIEENDDAYSGEA